MRPLVVLFIFISFTAISQKRIRPAQRYTPGDTIYAPRYGVTTIIPPGWDGVLPREAEMFLLMPQQPFDATIYIWGTENDNIDNLKKRWTKGVEMGSNIRLQASESLVQRGDAWTAEGKLSGSTATAGRRVYAEAKCGNGTCITYILESDTYSYEAARKSLMQLVDNSKLSEPRNVSIYEGFDWTEFLTNKVVMSYESDETKRKLNEVNLCKDGTFQSDIKRKGLLKGDLKEYQGKKKGRWSIGKGQTATLILEFDKAPKAEIQMRIEDEIVYANGARHFVATSESCK